MRARRAGLHTLVGAYVLDAVTDSDRAAFERHLLTCEQCREDVRGLREASARLAFAAAITPRPELREPTLRSASVIRQLPPVVAGDRPARLAPRRLLPRRQLSVAGVSGGRVSGAGVSGSGSGGGRSRGLVSGAGVPEGRVPAALGSAGRVLSGRLRPGLAARPWLAAVAAGVVAVLVVTAVLAGVHAGAMQQRLAAQQQHDSQVTAVLGAYDAVAMTASVSTGGTATVVMSHSGRALVFTASGLAQLPAARGYELWLAGPAGVRQAGMLPPGRNGMSGPVVVGSVGAGEQLELTVERAGGSPRPTSAPIVRLRLGP